MATECAVHQCACVACQAGNHPDPKDHRYLNVILSRLDEQQRSWVAGRDVRTQVNEIRHQERLAASDIQELRLQAIRGRESRHPDFPRVPLPVRISGTTHSGAKSACLSSPLRQHAAQVLGEIPTAGALAIHVLVEALDEEDEFVRLTVLNTLNNLGTAAAPATSALVKILADNNDIIERGIAASALGSIGPAAKRRCHSCSRASKSQEIVRRKFIFGSR